MRGTLDMDGPEILSQGTSPSTLFPSPFPTQGLFFKVFRIVALIFRSC